MSQDNIEVNALLPPAGTPTDMDQSQAAAAPFSEVQKQLAPPDPQPFTDVMSSQQPTTVNRYSDNQTGLTASLAALAQQKLDLADPDARLTELVGINHQIIEDGNEKKLRTQIANQSKLDTAQRIQDTQNAMLNASPGDTTFAGTKLSDLMNLGIDAQNAEPDQNALEKEGVSRLQTMAAADPDQAAIIQDLQKQGDVLDRVRDNVIKLQVFGREMDALTKARKEQGWLYDLNNFADDFLTLGFNNFIGRVNNMPNTPNKSFWDRPSTQENKEIMSFWDQPVDQFNKNIPTVFDNFTKQHFGLGIDLTQAEETARDYAKGGLNNSDSLSFDLWTTGNILAFVPVSRFAKVPSKMARLLGNRTASTDIVAQTLAKDTAGIADSTLANVQAPYHSVEESLPSSLVPDTQTLVRPDVGIVSDVADRLAAIKAATVEVQKGLATTERLEPAQLQQAIQKAVEEAQMAFKDENIVDMKAAVPDREPGEWPRVEEPSLKPAELNPEADLDNLSYTNARGEVYETPEEPGFRTNPGKIAQDHEDLVRRLETEATIKASGRQLPNTSFAPLENAKMTEVGGIRSIPTVSKERQTGIYSLNFYLGKKTASGGFLTKEGAENAAKRRGFDLADVGIHRNTDGQYFIKVRQAITETGISNPVLRAADFQGVYKPSQFIKSIDNLQPELFNQARITQTVGKSRFLAGVVKPYADNIRKLSKRSARNVAKVMAAGEREQTWYNMKEFDAQFERVANRLPTDKERLAYYSAKELSDLNYHIFNQSIYAQKARRGMVTVSAKNDLTGFDTGKMNGRVIADPDFSQLRIHDLDKNVSYPPDAGTKELQAKFETGRYRVIELERPYVRPAEDPVKYILAPLQDSTVGPLQVEQLGYIAGGSRENRFKWFVKQARKGSFADGTTFWTNPKTHVAARTGKQAREWADAMEKARLAYISKSMTEADKRLVIDGSPAESYDKFKQLADTGEIDTSTPFEALFDRDMPKAMTHIGDQDARWIEMDESPEEAYMISKGRMYYSKKGERLKDPNEDYAEILDPFTTLHKAIQNAAQTMAFGDYNQKVIDEWSRVATPFLNRNSVGNNLDSFNIFFNGKLSDDLLRSDPTFYNKLEMTRNTHKRFLGLQSPEQRWTYTAARRFGDWVENKGEFGEKLAGKVYDRMSNNPVNAVRGMVFDAKLGFFDPGQLIVQTQTAVAAMTANPIIGARTAAMLPALSHLMLNRSENLLDFYAKSLSTLHGLKPDDFKNMIRSLRNSGWMDVSGEVAQLDQYTNTIGGSAFIKGFNRVRTLGRIPFNLAEKFNRLTAYSMAWKLTRNAMPEAAATEKAFQGLVNKTADDLSMNMTSSSGAWWQKGPLSVPTQFLAYQTRMLENILPKTFGGTARFSAGQKFRLAVGQLMMYGTAGIPFGDFVAQQYQAATNQSLDPATWRMISKGFWDTMLFNVSGGELDTDFAARAGQGQAWTDFYRKLTDGTMNNVLEVATGPVGGVASNMVDTIGKMWQYMRAEQVDQLDGQTWALLAGDMTQQISSMNRAQQAYWIWKTGLLLDAKTGQPIVDASKLDAVAAALGIPLRQNIERWDIIRDNAFRQQQVDDTAKMIAQVRRNAFRAMEEGDEDKRQYYSRMASGLLMPYRDDPLLQQEIARRTEQLLGYTETEWNSLIQRTYEKTGKMPNGGK